ncbi:unnamed protein product [Nezara viridula]|uniref:Uncharacterized protein n=1 Tax=Nezara viridula TaxID=85310 RepID=A0A9P0MUL5_NEZVI|nr:unnamed protein product [Nezara viridula]
MHNLPLNNPRKKAEDLLQIVFTPIRMGPTLRLVIQFSQD